MDEVFFVVNVQDFIHKKPIVSVKYVGKSVKAAYTTYERIVSMNYKDFRITLDMIEGDFIKRLETCENK